jgi:hypothetical protein
LPTVMSISPTRLIDDPDMVQSRGDFKTALLPKACAKTCIPRRASATDAYWVGNDFCFRGLYERMMGAWSRLAGEIFLDWIAPRPRLRWIDGGCGNGAFTELVVERYASPRGSCSAPLR